MRAGKDGVDRIWEFRNLGIWGFGNFGICGFGDFGIRPWGPLKKTEDPFLRGDVFAS